jgi:putative salt-induced outer membrane protein YdiY
MKKSSTLKLSAGITAALVAGTASLLAQSAPTLTESAKWESSAAAGFTLTSGNSETLLATADLTSTRKWEKNEFTAAGNLTYGENSGQKNADSQKISLQYNRLLSEKAYVFGRAEWMRDSVAEIDYRISLSPGGGYYFWKDAKKGFVRGEVGPGYVFEKKGGGSKSYLTFRAAERFEFKISETAKFWQSLEYVPNTENFDDFQAIAEIGVDSKLTKKLSLRVYFQDTYNNVPAKGRKDNDFKAVSALSYTF